MTDAIETSSTETPSGINYAAMSTREKALYLRRAFCNTCNKPVLDKYGHKEINPKHDVDFNRRLTQSEIDSIVREPRSKRPKAASRVKDDKYYRRGFCVTCNKEVSNRYDHINKRHEVRPLAGQKPIKAKTPRGVVSVLGSKVKLNGHDTTTVTASSALGFSAGFKAGYDFRAGLEAYAANKHISIETLISSAVSTLEGKE